MVRYWKNSQHLNGEKYNENVCIKLKIEKKLVVSIQHLRGKDYGLLLKERRIFVLKNEGLVMVYLPCMKECKKRA